MLQKSRHVGREVLHCVDEDTSRMAGIERTGTAAVFDPPVPRIDSVDVGVTGKT